MSKIDDYRNEIQLYRQMYNVCIDLLKFNDNSKAKSIKPKLRQYGDEVINHDNKNRLKAIIKKTIEVEDTFSIDEIVLKESLEKRTGYSKYSSELAKYIRELYQFGPKHYMLECLRKISELKKSIRLEEENEMKEVEEEDTKSEYIGYKYEPKDYVHVADSITGSKMSQSVGKLTTHANKMAPGGILAERALIPNLPAPKTGLTLDEIINNHISNSNVYIEGSEISDIKDQFGLSFIDSRYGYLSDSTISDLFTIRMVNEMLDRREEVPLLGVVDAMDSMFSLAMVEMTYKRKSFNYGYKAAQNYENALNAIRDTNRDYVQEYTILYEKVQKYYKKLSKEERQEFDNLVERARFVKNGNQLMTPEEFRQTINKSAKERNGDWDIYTRIYAPSVANEVERFTKYMTSEELAEYYKEIKLNKKGYDELTLQEIFALLIARRMKYTEDKEEQRRRLTAVCNEYLEEDPIFINSQDIVLQPSYAKDRIEGREEIDKQEKKYFRMSKLKQAMQLMNYKKLQRYSNKSVLTEDEVQKIRRMF